MVNGIFVGVLIIAMSDRENQYDQEPFGKHNQIHSQVIDIGKYFSI